MDGVGDIAGSIATGSDAFLRMLRGYLAIVAAELGVGLESCTVDVDLPVSAYLALDQRVAAFPERDVALLWDERHGWSLAVETHSGEDLIVLAYLDADTVAPSAELVVRFVEEICAGESKLGIPDPPAIRRPGDRGGLFPKPPLAGVA